MKDEIRIKENSWKKLWINGLDVVTDPNDYGLDDDDYVRLKKLFYNLLLREIERRLQSL